MAAPASLSGFPEWLPAERLVEMQVLDTLRHTFELHGFAALETRSVEPLEVLERKGDIDKEIFLLRRLHEDPATEDDGDSDAGRTLALRFDNTVPFARYVRERAGHLRFPFRRYQIQKVWRGERPQDGRFREFTQADIDVIGDGDLPFHYDLELPLVMAEALAALPIGQVRIHVNNRKLSEGFYRGLGLTDVTGVLREIDKLDKIGPAAVAKLLVERCGASAEQADAALALAAISGADASFADRVRALGVAHPLLDEGLAELTAVVEGAAARRPGSIVADLKIARGLDYYTGSVYESFLVGQEDLGSICSGGRYDNLATEGNRTHPGVGLSIGVSRLVSRIIGAGLVRATREVPTAVLVALIDEDHRLAADRLAAGLRSRDVPCEVAPAAVKYGKQIRYADRRGIPFVLFPQPDGTVEVRDIRSGEQVPVDPETWTPPAEDVRPRVVAGD